MLFIYLSWSEGENMAPHHNSTPFLFTRFPLLFLTLYFCIIPQPAWAMHIAEGFLPASWAFFWYLLFAPFFLFGLRKLQEITTTETPDEKARVLLLLALCGAFVFILSSLKLPSVTGSCSHPTGTGLGAILFGPGIMSILGTIALLFQALLLAHGGLTTLGANAFSMAIAGPFVAWAVFLVCRKLSLSLFIASFCAATIGDLFTYCVTSFQLAFAFPDPQGGVLLSVWKYLGIFAVTQVPLALIEGLLTAMTIKALTEYGVLEQFFSFLPKEKKQSKSPSLLPWGIATSFLLLSLLPKVFGMNLSGSDDQAVKAISQTGYMPWFSSLWQPGVYEPYLFIFQGLIGISVFVLFFFRLQRQK